MKIKVIKEIKGQTKYNYSVRFKIEMIEDDEIFKIIKFTSILIDMNPNYVSGGNYGSSSERSLFKPKTWVFELKNKGNDQLNFDELYSIEFSFLSKKTAEDYTKYVLDQFAYEITRINELDLNYSKEEIYEIKADKGIKKIYEGAEKVLDKNSVEYKEIVEKNREAWKKLADL